MIDVRVDSQNTFSAIAKFAAALKDRRNENRKVAIQFFSFVQKNFTQSGALQPAGWRPLAPGTLAEKKRKGYSSKPLVRTGNLRQSFLMFSDNDQAGVGAAASFGVDYAKVHEEGSEDGRIPQRKMLPPERLAQIMVTNVYGLKIADDRAKAGL